MSTREKREISKKEELAQLRKQLAVYQADLEKLMSEDRTEYAQNIIDKMFAEFRAGGRWTNKMKDMAENVYHVFSPIGRKRNLFAAMTGDRSIIAQQVRRGANAPIQGFASEIGVKAGRLLMECYYKALPELCEMLDIEYDPWALRVPYNRMVHDASYYSVPYCMIIPFVHMLQYSATYGITELYKEQFGIEFTVEPEIEIEFGARDDKTMKWDWSLPSIVTCITSSVNDLETFGILEGKKEDVIKTIFRPWANKKTRALLQSRYPLLGVENLDKQIIAAIRPIYK
jgi:hypothetical protein